MAAAGWSAELAPQASAAPGLICSSLSSTSLSSRSSLPVYQSAASAVYQSAVPSLAKADYQFAATISTVQASVPFHSSTSSRLQHFRLQNPVHSIGSRSTCQTCPSAAIAEQLLLGRHPGAPDPPGAISSISALDHLSELVSSGLLLRLHFLQLISSSLLPRLLGRQ